VWQQAWTLLTSYYHWLFLSIALIFPLGGSVLNFYNIKKTRLELEKLKIELATRNTSLVSKVTLDEIERFASKNPSAKEVSRFIMPSLNRTKYYDAESVLSRADVKRYTDAIAQVEQPLSEDIEYFQDFFTSLVRVQAPVLLLYLLVLVVSARIGSFWGTGLVTLSGALIATFASSRLRPPFPHSKETIKSPDHSSVARIEHEETTQYSRFGAFFRLVGTFFVSLLSVSLLGQAMLSVIDKLENAHALSFTDQSYIALQFNLYGSLFLVLVPVITVASFSLARNRSPISYWLFLVSTVVASVVWIGVNLLIGENTGFGDVNQFRSATGFSGGSADLVSVFQTLVGLGICAVTALYQWLVWMLAKYFAGFRKQR